MNDEFENVLPDEIDGSKTDMQAQQAAEEVIAAAESAVVSEQAVQAVEMPAQPEAAAQEEPSLQSYTDSELHAAYRIAAEIDTLEPEKEPPIVYGRREPLYRERIKNETHRRENRKFRRAVAITAIAALIGGSTLGFGIGVGTQWADQYFIPRLMDDSKEVESFRFDEQGEAREVGAFGAGGYASLVAAVEPSVVNISANVVREQSYYNFSVPQEGTVAGSGILYFETDTRYYIVTNNHVTEGAQQVFVSIEEHDGVPATLVGKDAMNDLAVISILKADVVKAGVKNVTIAKFGDSDAMRVGDVVLAIGNALGEGNTATNGIISAPPREVSIQGRALMLLQTNAAINEGNSGGPLVNMNGEVIGINTAKISGSTASASIEGMGYAIPSNVVKPIIEGLMKAKPMLGVQINDVSDEMARQFNLPQAGAIIVGLVEGAPAEEAGLLVNDIITGINDDPVLTSAQLQETIARYKIGDTVQVKIIRDGKEFLTIPVKLTENTAARF